jgi:hypothetical protein
MVDIGVAVPTENDATPHLIEDLVEVSAAESRDGVLLGGEVVKVKTPRLVFSAYEAAHE